MFRLGLRGNGFGDFGDLPDGFPEIWSIRGDRERDDGVRSSFADDSFLSYMWGDKEPFREDPDYWVVEPGTETPLAESFHRVPSDGAPAARSGLLRDLSDRGTLRDPGSW